MKTPHGSFLPDLHIQSHALGACVEVWDEKISKSSINGFAHIYTHKYLIHIYEYNPLFTCWVIKCSYLLINSILEITRMRAYITRSCAPIKLKRFFLSVFIKLSTGHLARKMPKDIRTRPFWGALVKVLKVVLHCGS